MFHNIPPLSLTNPIASTLRAHFTSQDDTLLASLRDKATHITDPHTYKQTYCELSLRKTHASLLPRLTPLWKNNITTWPQVLLRATSSSILKSCKSISKLTGSTIEIVYNMYRMRRLLSLGPPNYAIHGTYKSGLDH
jgi:hypothetical protein